MHHTHVRDVCSIRLLDDFAYGIVRERREEFRQEEERRKNGEIEPSDSTWRKRNDILSLYMRRENTDGMYVLLWYQCHALVEWVICDVRLNLKCLLSMDKMRV